MATPVIGKIGEKLDLLIRQGATFGPYKVHLATATAPVDLTGCVIKGSIRKEIADVTPVATLDIVITDAVNGDFTYGLTVAKTVGLAAGATLKDPVGKHFWDMEITWVGGAVDPLFYGDVTVFREITRE